MTIWDFFDHHADGIGGLLIAGMFTTVFVVYIWRLTR